jgi:hypothetical protein
MNKTEYNCDICKKIYSTRKTLWTHNNKFHKNVELISEFKCRICQKEYKCKQSRYVHEKKCDYVSPLSTELILEKEKQKTANIYIEAEKIRIEAEKYKIIEIDKEQALIKSKLELQNSKKPSNTSFLAFNRRLKKRSNLIKKQINNANNNTTNSHNTTTNSHNTNTQIINITFPNISSLGKENVLETLSFSEKKRIMDTMWMSMDTAVDVINCGDHDEFKNIVITNLTDDFAYTYDETDGCFNRVNKKNLMNELITYRVVNLEMIYGELEETNVLDRKTKTKIQQFFKQMESNQPFYDDNGKKYDDYKTFKAKDIILLLYKNTEKITQDLNLLLDKKEEAEAKARVEMKSRANNTKNANADTNENAKTDININLTACGENTIMNA